jgi:hypothetical protein
MKFLASIMGAFLVGCAHQPLNAPQSGAVEGGLSSIKSGVSTAESQRGAIVQHNAAARSISRTIHDKDELIDAYHKWKTLHATPTPIPQ